MKDREPKVYLISRPQIDWPNMLDYLYDVGGKDAAEWAVDKVGGSGQTLVEAMGRLCYRSWAPGLNPNVTKVRKDQSAYLQHIIESKHGSVLEHANYGFIFSGVSRVFTHELVRHRAGTAISQESMRFVRLTDIPMWIPDWAQDDEELMSMVRSNLEAQEHMQQWMAEHFGLDAPGVPFNEKKEKTSFMRRFAPEGVSTDIGWTANVRTLRHVIEARTNPAAEEEIRLVFDQVAETMVIECPELFGDFTRTKDGQWVTKWSKV